MVYLITENGNNFLKGRRFMPNKSVIAHLKKTLSEYDGDQSIEGYDRLVHLIDMVDNKGGIEYNEMKRLQNWFDTHRFSGKTQSYDLNGGKTMDTWVHNKLKSARLAAANLSDIQKKMDKATQKNKLKPVKPKLDADFKAHKRFLDTLSSLK